MDERHDSKHREADFLASLSGLDDSWRAEVTDRDIALGILPPDYEAQLVAILDLLSSSREAEERKAARLRELDATGRVQPSERIADERVDQLHGITYQDATHSMAAVGLLAPFIESMFVHFFRHLARISHTHKKAPASGGC